MINWKRFAFNLTLTVSSVALPVGGIVAITTNTPPTPLATAGVVLLFVSIFVLCPVAVVNFITGNLLEEWVEKHYKIAKPKAKADPKPQDWR